MAALRPLQRLLIFPALFFAGAALVLAQDLPKKTSSLDVDLEPKLMLSDVPNLTLPGTDSAMPATSSPPLNVAKLEAELEKAKKNAAWRERLYKSGVLSKVEAEQAALKIVRVTRDLENARLQALTHETDDLRKAAEKDESSKAKLPEAEAVLATLKANFTAASAKWDDAQRAAAELRVQRERKLLSLGAGSRYSVKRAEAALQAIAPASSN